MNDYGGLLPAIALIVLGWYSKTGGDASIAPEREKRGVQ
jgi:hypothetical protein